MTNSSLLLSIVTFVYGLAGLLYISSWIFRKKAAGIAATWVTVAGCLGNLAGILLRWYESYQIEGGYGHAPLSNIYESLVFFAWTIALIYIVVERKYRNRIFGSFALPLAFFALAYASFGTSAKIQPLIPALKSNWLIAHVVACFIGYAAFAVGATSGIIFLVKNKDSFNIAPLYKKVLLALSAILWSLGIISLFFIAHALMTHFGTKLSGVPGFTMALAVIEPVSTIFVYLYNWAGLPGGGNFPIVFAVFVMVCGLVGTLFYMNPNSLVFKRLPDLNIVDELTHQLIMFGFLFLTAGIITGAVWANSAWGRYWGWDPKETWSLITWFVYATLLHARLMRGWKGTPIAILSVVGFLAVMFTYFGVNLLPGLHSYGAMKG